MHNYYKKQNNLSGGELRETNILGKFFQSEVYCAEMTHNAYKIIP